MIALITCMLGRQYVGNLYSSCKVNEQLLRGDRLPVVTDMLENGGNSYKLELQGSDTVTVHELNRGYVNHKDTSKVYYSEKDNMIIVSLPKFTGLYVSMKAGLLVDSLFVGTFLWLYFKFKNTSKKLLYSRQAGYFVSMIAFWVVMNTLVTIILFT